MNPASLQQYSAINKSPSSSENSVVNCGIIEGKEPNHTGESDFISDWPQDPELGNDGDLNVSCGCLSNEVLTCSKQFFTLKRRLPIIKWVRKYSCAFFLRDLIAGITVALTVVPQGIAYARIANLPPEYGLYSSFIGPLVYMLLGTSKDITMGPTAVMSLIVAEHIQHAGPQYAVVLCFFTGIVQLLIGVLQLGALVNYVSHPVISGFTSGAALIIAYGQVKNLLGISKVDSDYLTVQIYQTFKYIKDINWWDVVLGLTCLATLLLLRKMRSVVLFPNSGGLQGPHMLVVLLRKILWLVCIASNAIVVICATLFVFIYTKFSSKCNFSLVGEIPAGHIPVDIPPFAFQSKNETVTFVDVASQIRSGFIVVPLLGILESIAIAKSFARKNNYRIDTTQEILAIGISNIFGSFFSSYPITGSFSRTAVNSQCNVATPIGGLFTASIVISALMFLAPAFKYIPEASLAALIMASIVFNFDYEIIKQLFVIKKTDFLTVVCTIAMCCLTSAEYGIISGIILSLFFSLLPLSRPGLKMKSFKEGLVVITRFDHGLNFPSAEPIVDFFVDQIQQAEKNHKRGISKVPKCCIIDLGRVWQIDQSVLCSFATVKYLMESKSILVYFIRACPAVLATMKRAETFGSYGMPKEWNYFSSLDLALADFNSRSSQYTDDSPLISKRPSIVACAEEEQEDDVEAITGTDFKSEPDCDRDRSSDPHPMVTDGCGDIVIDSFGDSSSS